MFLLGDFPVTWKPCDRIRDSSNKGRSNCIELTLFNLIVNLSLHVFFVLGSQDCYTLSYSPWNHPLASWNHFRARLRDPIKSAVGPNTTFLLLAGSFQTTSLKKLRNFSTAQKIFLSCPLVTHDQNWINLTYIIKIFFQQLCQTTTVLCVC